MLDSIIPYIQQNQVDIILCTVAGSVILSLILTFMGKVVFYNDFKDLGLSAALCLLPLFIIYAGVFFLGDLSIDIAVVTFVLLLIPSAYNTWRANKSVWKTVIVLISKTALSFVYAFYLLELIFPKKGGKRSLAPAIVLAILTPLLFALVHDKSKITG